MKLFQEKLLLFSSVIMIALSGCGSSRSSGSSNNTTSLTGNVADGYLVGAEVCLDKNENSKCDDNEPTTKTKMNGVYTLENITKEDINKYPLLVEVDELVIDEDDNKSVEEYYTLSASPGQTFISPISTMIRNYEITNNVNYEEAKSKIAQLLEIDDISLIDKDYIKNSSIQEAQNLHKKAKVIVKLKMEILEKLGNIAYSAEAKNVDKYINDKIMNKLSFIDTQSNLDENDIANNIINNYIDLSDKDELNKVENTTLNDLLNGSIIKQNVRYTKTYNGGTDIKKYTIEDSANKHCMMYILDSTKAYNPYGESYKINFSDYTPTTIYDLGTKNTNNEFYISWMYYTQTNSHLDFYVTCK